MAGSLMNSAGITNRIYDFALALVGWLKGGLGHVNVVGSVIFAGMSGTAVADAGGLGNIEIKAMRDHGYSVDFAVGVTGASSTIGPIIPPSLPFVIYGVMANASIGKLFAAGVIPGLVMALTMMIMVTYYAHTRGWHRDTNSPSSPWKTFKQAFLPAAPVIRWRDDAACSADRSACRHCHLHRGWGLPDLSFGPSGEHGDGGPHPHLLIVAGASIFGYLITLTKVTDNVSALVLSITTQPWAILLLVNVFLLIVGCFMETIASITILVPVLLPLMDKIGVDPVHFGLVMVLNLMIGLLTPPVGMVLYILARVAGISFERTTKACLPFLFPLLVSLPGPTGRAWSCSCRTCSISRASASGSYDTAARNEET
jgi:TRAP-type C4-dicarboxylate transport system permease large subunit